MPGLMMSFLLKSLHELLFQSSAKLVKKTSLGRASLQLLGRRSNDKALKDKFSKRTLLGNLDIKTEVP